MAVKALFEVLIDECEGKLGRGLDEQERMLIKWIEERQLELHFKNMKTS